MSTPDDLPKVGLALGGGGARGLAHIGVLQVLTHEGIPIDVLAGTSMGGLIAGAFAAGIAPAQMAEEARRMGELRNLVQLVNLAPSGRGLLHPDHIREYLIDLLGPDRTIEGLHRPIALAAVDLYRAEEVALTSGPLVEAILATIAVPGLFPPVRLSGRTLVDGGVLNNVPADLARNLGAKVVIAVEIGLSPDAGAGEHFLDGTGRLAGLVPRFAQEFYWAEMVMVSALARRRLEEVKPEIWLQPSIGPHITIFTGFSHAEEVIAAGVEAAEEALPDIRRAIEARRGNWLSRLFRRPRKG